MYTLPKTLDQALESLELHSHMLLTSEQHEQLQSHLVGGGERFHATAGSMGTDDNGRRVTIFERVTLRRLAASEVAYWRDAVMQPIKEDQAYQSLVAIDLFVDPDPLRDAPPDPLGSLAEAITWLQREFELQGFAKAEFGFASGTYRPAIALPLALEGLPPGFSAINGLTLTKREGDRPNGRLLYAATLSREFEDIDVEVRFMAPLSADSDAVASAAAHASEVANMLVKRMDASALAEPANE